MANIPLQHGAFIAPYHDVDESPREEFELVQGERQKGVDMAFAK